MGEDPAARWPDVCRDCHLVGLANYLQARLDLVPAAVARAGVPPRFRRPDLPFPADLDNLMGNGAGVFLHGDPGVGKSMAMGLLVRQLFEDWAKKPTNAWERKLPDNVRWVDYPGFTMEIQDAFKNGNGETTAYRLLKSMAAVDHLVLDDIGVEKGTPFVVQATYYLLDQREKWMRPTYITTNVKLPELDDQYGGRITDRIAGTCVVKEVLGKSRRIKP